MTAREFQACVADLPASVSKLFLHQLTEALALWQLFEVRVTFLSRLIFHSNERSVASRTPVAVLQALCQSDALTSVAPPNTMADKDALIRVPRLYVPIQPLEAFLWALMPTASQKVRFLKPPETTLP